MGNYKLELIDKFIKFEYDYDLFNKEIQGVKIWHYIRFSIYNEILKQKYNISQAHSNLVGKSYLTRIWYKIRQIPDFILRNPLYGLKQKNILVLNCARRIKEGNYFKDIYTDDILSNINYSYYVFEEPYLEKHFKPVKTKGLRYFDYIDFLSAIKIEIYKLLNKKCYYFNKQDNNEIIALVDNIEKLFKIDIDIEKFSKMVKITSLKYRFIKNYYRRLLDRVQPKIIIEECSYGFRRLLINEIAYEKGIPTAELQHGTMGKYHIAYNFYNKTKISTFPDYIFLFGKYWKDNTRFPLEDDKLIVTGFPYFESKLNQLNICQKNKKENILFISQGTIGKKLSKLAVRLDKIINHKKYNIIYKLHPGEYNRWQKEYPWLKESNIKVINNSKNGIYYHFSKCNFQVGVYSTAIFEGLGFDLKTFIYKAYGHEYMRNLYENNYAKLIVSAEEIVEGLDSNKNNIENKEFFWKSNSLKSIVNNVKNIYDHD